MREANFDNNIESPTNHNTLSVRRFRRLAKVAGLASLSILAACGSTGVASSPDSTPSSTTPPPTSSGRGNTPTQNTLNPNFDLCAVIPSSVAAEVTGTTSFHCYPHVNFGTGDYNSTINAAWKFKDSGVNSIASVVALIEPEHISPNSTGTHASSMTKFFRDITPDAQPIYGGVDGENAYWSSAGQSLLVNEGDYDVQIQALWYTIPLNSEQRLSTLASAVIVYGLEGSQSVFKS